MPGRSRLVLLVAGTAAVSIAAGFAAATQVVSPAEMAARAEPPPAGPITAPVERRVLESRVVTRGDTSFDDAVEVLVPAGGLAVTPVVSGRVPEVGAAIDEGNVLLEVSGRPVLALRGALRMYRTLLPGMSGPDVAQLEEVLARMGLNPGRVDGRYDTTTGNAVGELFRRSGYEAPAVPSVLDDEVDAARKAVAGAEQAAAAARVALKKASAGPPESERLAALAAVRTAERALHAAEAAGNAAEIAAAREQIDIARAQEAELLAPEDAAAEAAAATATRRELAQARRELAEVEATVGTPAPAAELAFLPTLPRRVDQVNVALGDPVDGPVMVVSGANLVVTGPVSDGERQLLSEGMPAVLEHGTAFRVAGKITAIARAPEGETGFEVQVAPEKLTGEQAEVLRGANVRVTIPVKSTEGEVLAVPLAALSAAAGGQSRVEAQRGGKTSLVAVEVGLTADGFAEIRPRNLDLEEGDLVVVGR